MASLVITVPYGATFVPGPISRRLGLTDGRDLGREHWYLTDPIILNLAAKMLYRGQDKPPRPFVPFRFSPLVIDPLGLLSSELSGSQPNGPNFLSNFTTGAKFPVYSEDERQIIINQAVKPYFEQLEAACSNELANNNLVALITLRSFATVPQPHERDRRLPRPQVSLGSNSQHSPEGLVTLAGTIFRALGLWPQLNWPLISADPPGPLAAQVRLKTLSLGLRRDLYMDEKTGKLKDTAEGLVRVLSIFFDLLEQELDRVANIRLRRAFPPKKPSNIIKSDDPPMTNKVKKPYMKVR
ncbi:MAG: N-formylglutamate amidohydrolase [Deltaproteobacteria bacterium]|nr:N-formylglutamate amidohydrolase [Deltaproteobacteria bacterium]